MSEVNILEDSKGMNCPRCDKWVPQPDDASITTVDCPGCGAEVTFSEPIKRAPRHRESPRKTSALLLGASVAVILGIYGYSIFSTKTAQDDLVLAPVRPVPAEPDTSTPADPQMPANDDETAQVDQPTPVTPEPSPPIIIAILDPLPYEDDEGASEPNESPPTTIIEIEPEEDPPTAIVVVEEPMPIDPIADTPVVEVEEVVAVDENEFLETGWKIVASETLRGFIAATTLDVRAAFVMDPERVRSRMRALEQQGNMPWKGLSPEDFKHIDLSEADRRKGIFLMLRETPGEDPAATADRSYAFFKRTEDGLKLDFEVLLQTTGKIFPNFIERPQPGVTSIFRVFIAEDPAAREAGTSNYAPYFIAGLSNFSSATRIRVTNQSPVGRILGAADFTSEDGARRVMRNATVELRWTDHPENPTIELSKFICWEFLGLGGEPLED